GGDLSTAFDLCDYCLRGVHPPGELGLRQPGGLASIVGHLGKIVCQFCLSCRSVVCGSLTVSNRGQRLCWNVGRWGGVHWFSHRLFSLSLPLRPPSPQDLASLVVSLSMERCQCDGLSLRVEDVGDPARYTFAGEPEFEQSVAQCFRQWHPKHIPCSR